MKKVFLLLVLSAGAFAAKGQSADIRQNTNSALPATDAVQVTQTPSAGPDIRQNAAAVIGAPATEVQQTPATGAETRQTTQPSLPATQPPKERPH